jgi:hypothetical protein
MKLLKLFVFSIFHVANMMTIRLTRRLVGSSLATIMGTSLVTNRPAQCANLNGDTLRETIAVAASQLPGYGSPDIFYPEVFEGGWDCSRELISSIIKDEYRDTFLDDVAQENALLTNRLLHYRVRFILQHEHIVLDRAFGAKNFEAAKSSTLAALSSHHDEVVTNVAWEVDNPNLLTVGFADGRLREVKVTKRATDQPSVGSFGSSEYARIAVVEPNGQLGGKASTYKPFF